MMVPAHLGKPICASPCLRTICAVTCCLLPLQCQTRSVLVPFHFLFSSRRSLHAHSVNYTLVPPIHKNQLDKHYAHIQQHSNINKIHSPPKKKITPSPERQAQYLCCTCLVTQGTDIAQKSGGALRGTKEACSISSFIIRAPETVATVWSRRIRLPVV